MTHKPQFESVQQEHQKSSIIYYTFEAQQFEPFWHYHPEFELTYINKGKGVRIIGENISSFHKGDLVLIGKNLPHNYVSELSKSNQGMQAYVFQFSDNLFTQFPECTQILKLLDDAKQGLSFTNISTQLAKRITSFSLLSPLTRLISFLEIFKSLSEDYEALKLCTLSSKEQLSVIKHQHKVAQVTKYIFENYHQPISLQLMANRYNLTPPSFSRWFKHATGINFINYVNSIRIERATEQILYSDKTITEIAYECGFESTSTFHRTFKKIKKTAPTSYRNKLKES